MAIPVIMPKQGQSVESCILTSWTKKKGDTILKGDILFAYETDKASFEAEAEMDGVLLEIFYSAGDEIPVLTNVAVIGQPGEATDAFRPGAGTSPLAKKAESTDEAETLLPTEMPGILQENTAGIHAENRKISPRARRLAEKKGVDYLILNGTGPEGRIIERDVQQYLLHKNPLTPLAQRVAARDGLTASLSGTGLAGAITSADLVHPAAAGAAIPDYTDQPLTQIRKIISRAMHGSLQNSAQLTHHMGADVSRLQVLRKKVKAANEKGFPYNLTLNDMICYAVIRALRKHPLANAHFMGESIRYFSGVHLGLAVDTERGLMVPALRNASDLSLIELSAGLKKMADQCRNGSINPDLLASTSASFTVSNLGNYGVEMFTPVINLPQVAILGINTIIYRPRQREDGILEFAPFIGLSLTYDHRAIDGGPATKFLAEIRNEIEYIDEKSIEL